MKYVPLLSASLLALGVAATAPADTLKKVADSGKLTLAYRESSVPFSYVEGPGKPLGFSMDIANAVVQEVKKRTGKPVLEIEYIPVTSQNRIPLLVNGTIATMGENWAVLSPLLKNNGYCVFAFNYGGTWLSTLLLGNLQGLDSVAGSANELKSFVNFVLSTTGASKVDLVGHSQGGMMPNYYVKFLGGAPKVHSIVALAPDNHGTTLSGLVTLGNQFSQIFPPLMPFINIMLGLAAPSFVDQQIGSPFIQQLNSLPDTVPGIDTFYVADDRLGSGGGVQRWYLNNNSWTLDGTLATGVLSGARGITGYRSGSNTTLLVTTAESTGVQTRLVSFTDDGSAAASLTPTVLATAATNTAYRGVCLAPTN